MLGNFIAGSRIHGNHDSWKSGKKGTSINDHRGNKYFVSFIDNFMNNIYLECIGDISEHESDSCRGPFKLLRGLY